MQVAEEFGAEPAALNKASRKVGRRALVRLRLDFLAPDPSLVPFMPVAATRKGFGDKPPDERGPDALQLDCSPLAQLSGPQLEKYRSSLTERIRQCTGSAELQTAAAGTALGALAAGGAAESVAAELAEGALGQSSAVAGQPGGGMELQVSFSLPSAGLFWGGTSVPAKQGGWMQHTWRSVPLPSPPPSSPHPKPMEL